MRNTTILLLITLLATSCAVSKLQLYDTLTGDWKAEKYRIKINSLNGGTKDSVTIISVEEFQEEMGFSGNYARYKENGDYTMLFTDSTNHSILKVTGMWRLEGDTLLINQVVPQERLMQYEVKSKRNKAIYSGLIDYDNDGEEDDELTIVATKLEPGNWPKD